MTLFVGLGYLICIPLATAIGRRPVIIGAAAITTASTLWAGFAGGFFQLLVALSLQGFAVGGSISMCLLMILDATFIHERPYALSIYWCLGSAVIKSLTVPLPFITSLSTDWRHVYQLWSGVSVLSLALLLAFVPETFYIRPPVAFDGRVLVQNGFERAQMYDDWDLLQNSQNTKPLPDPPQRWSVTDQLKVSKARGAEWRSMLATFAQMPFCLINPLIFWVALLNACLLGAVIYLNLLQPSILNHRSDDVETNSVFLSISGAVGALLALPFSGPLTAWFTRFLSLRSGGTRHAEVYLPGFAIPTITGCLAVGLACAAVERDWSSAWQYVASTLSMLSYNTGNVATVLWMTEAFPRWASAALSVLLFTGNLVAFIIGFKLSPWLPDDQIVPQSMVVIGLLAIMGIIAVPVAFWGKSVRQYIQCRWTLSEKGVIHSQRTGSVST
ncbi:uncharacterized protein JN550_002563 [Neoarthrinium moseri]|uniref:uncharacterized protein n=1 Tax=Neoarthrinium moseri TaxID=1658444 RepID=UPI001FDD53FD|nr:uncharacterized protein JN550_002563 [Neoarthrinium moseri]KAI1875134.1 hypothetical protein JN550_002563 [Neoarthrinium moseri]